MTKEEFARYMREIREARDATYSRGFGRPGRRPYLKSAVRILKRLRKK